MEGKGSNQKIRQGRVIFLERPLRDDYNSPDGYGIDPASSSIIGNGDGYGDPLCLDDGDGSGAGENSDLGEDAYYESNHQRILRYGY